MELTREQQQAVAASPDTPARVHEPGTQQVHVLLPAEDYQWIRGLVRDLPDTPPRIDPRTRAEYVLLPEIVYERFKAFFEEDPITPEERRALLREFGKRAGWDDPELDVYEEYRKKT